MLQVKVKSKYYTIFRCPDCGANDVAYSKLPRTCWQCGYQYTANVEDMIRSLPLRVAYHFSKIVEDIEQP